MAKGSTRGIPTARWTSERKTTPLERRASSSSPPPAPAMAAGNVEKKRPTFRLFVNLLIGAHERHPGVYASGHASAGVADGGRDPTPWPGLKKPSHWTARSGAVGGYL